MGNLLAYLPAQNGRHESSPRDLQAAASPQTGDDSDHGYQSITHTQTHTQTQLAT